MIRSASILTIGKELLIGQVQDTNSTWLAQRLTTHGIQLDRITTLDDDYDRIIEFLQTRFGQSDLVIITGGLGPTNDDITKSVLCDFFNDELVFHEATYQAMVSLFKKYNRTPMPSHKVQAAMPTKARILENKMGTAPGMLFEKDGKFILSLPGVPYEMKYIFNESFVPIVEPLFESQSIYHTTLRTVGIGEGMLAKEIEDIETSLPDHIDMAYLPSIGQVRIRLTGIGSSDELVEHDIQSIKIEIEKRISGYIYGYNKTTLAEAVGELCVDHSLSLALAESCTGGLVSQMITSVPGCSKYYKGSIVSYSYELKENLLSVGRDVLDGHGAVSEETVVAMVKGCINKLDVDIALAISGIAGPDGGTEDKPVGTVWMACGDRGNVVTRKLSLSKERNINIQYSAIAGLDMIRKFIIA